MTPKVLFWLAGYTQCNPLTNISPELLSSKSSKAEKKQENPDERCLAQYLAFHQKKKKEYNKNKFTFSNNTEFSSYSH